MRRAARAVALALSVLTFGTVGAGEAMAQTPPDTTGVSVSYYEGRWTRLPDFNALTPINTGVVGNFDIDTRNSDSNFGFVFEGFLEVEADGTYDFFTTSDDGSRLFIGGTLVVDNDGLHAARERTGSIDLTEGRHPIRVEMFELWGREVLDVAWDGPGFDKQPIPDRLLFRDGTYDPSLKQEVVVNGGSGSGRYYPGTVIEIEGTDPALGEAFTGWEGDVGALADPNTLDTTLTVGNEDITVTLGTEALPAETPGVRATYYQGDWSSRWSVLPDFSEIEQTSRIVENNFDIDMRDEDSNFAFVHETYLEVLEPGEYAFQTRSDDGSKLFVNGELVVDNDGLHAARTREGSIELAQGRHLVRVEMFERWGREVLEVTWTPPGADEPEAIPDDVLFRSGEFDPATVSTIAVSGGTIDGRTTRVARAGQRLGLIADPAPSGQEFAGWVGDVGALDDQSDAETFLTAAAGTVNVTATFSNLPSNTPGLNVAYFEMDSWGLRSLDDILSLPPVRTGAATNASIEDRDRDSRFGFRWTGFIEVLNDGDYTFHLTSDDGSRLTVNDTLVIDNDGLHAAREKSGTITLAQGRHAVDIQFFENWGDEVFELEWEGPGIERAEIPDRAFWRSGVFDPAVVAALEVVGGLTDYSANYYKGSTVDIVAAVPELGTEFTGWAGDVAALADPAVPATTVTLDDDVSVTAQYTALPGAARGLDYVYYETDLKNPPRVLAEIIGVNPPVAIGQVVNYDLSPRLQDDQFGFSFGGFIQIDVAGTYTFYTTSNDGSQLFINDALVVDNDGTHSPREKSGMIDLPVGRHEIVVTYFEGRGTEVLEVEYKGPGIEQQAIPDEVLFRSPIYVAPSFDLVVNAGSGDGSYTAGTPVTITADAPAVGKEFDRWAGDVALLANPQAATTTLTMGQANAIVTATYQDALFALTVNSGAGDGDYKLGDVVAVTADAAPEGQTFAAWVGDIAGLADATAAETTFTMAAAAATITATYADKPLNDLTVVGGSGTGRYFEGQTVTVTADAAPAGRAFDTWSATAGTFADANAATTTFTMPNAAATVTANYNFELIVNGGSGDGVYAEGEVVAIAADPAPTGQVFDRWLGDIATVAVANAAETTITMPAQGAVLTASYVPEVVQPNGVNFAYYELGGLNELPNFDNLTPTTTGVVDNFDISERTRDERFGFRFTGFIEIETAGEYKFYTNSDDGSHLYIADTLIVDNDGLHGPQDRFGFVDLTPGRHAITVTFFENSGGEKLEVTWSGPGFDRQAIPNDILFTTDQRPEFVLTVTDGQGSGTYQVGTVIDVLANDAPAGFVFDQWIGDVAEIEDATQAATRITMREQNTTIAAQFVAGDGAFTLAIVNGAGDGAFLPATPVVITADEPAAEMVFDRWVGASEVLALLVSETDSPTTLNMPASNALLTATYRIRTYGVEVVGGTGSGDYPAGTEVVISAPGFVGDQVFDRWTGNIEGLADEFAATTTLTVGSAPVTLTATYIDPDEAAGTIAFESPLDGATVDARGFVVIGNATSNDGIVQIEASLDDPAQGRTINQVPLAVGTITGQFALRVFPDDITEGQDVTVTITARTGANARITNSLTVTVGAADFAKRQLVNRITFGETPALLARLNDLTFDQYLDEQLAPALIDDSAAQAMLRQEALSDDDDDFVEELREEVLTRMVFSERQLLEVMTQFWDNHFNTDIRKVNSVEMEQGENDGFRLNALGNFRDLTEVSAKSPAMMIYLDNDDNRVAPNAANPNPNENYARELMELHLLGVTAPYTDTDVNEASLILSGWQEQNDQFFFDASDHYSARAKSIWQVWGANARTFGPGGIEEGEQMIDFLAQDFAAVGGVRAPGTYTSRFVCRKLVEMLVSEAVPSTVVEQCAAAFEAPLDPDGDGVSRTGEVIPMLEAIFDSAEFRTDATAFRSKVKTPLEFAVGVIRNLDAEPDYDEMDGAIQAAGMGLFINPVPTGWSEVGADWINSNTLLQRLQFAIDVIESRGGGSRADLRMLMLDAGAESPEAVVALLMELTVGLEHSRLVFDQAVAELTRDGDFDISSTNSNEPLRRAAVLVIGQPGYQYQ